MVLIAVVELVELTETHTNTQRDRKRGCERGREHESMRKGLRENESACFWLKALHCTKSDIRLNYFALCILFA